MSEEKEKYEKYLEGDYDSGNIVKKYKQWADDRQKALEIADAVDKMYQEYNTNEKSKEYLWNQAVLQCDQATLEPFEKENGEKIILKVSNTEKKEERLYTTLSVPKEDHEVDDNGIPKARISDIKMEAFRCNCKRPADRLSEKIAIEKEPRISQEGVCRLLMKLNSEWENWDNESGMVEKKGTGEESVTMSAMLFCKHGGIITPIKSGHERNANVYVFFSKEELVACGWNQVTDEEVESFNKALENFGVTSKESAYLLIATMLSESGCEYPSEGEFVGSKYDVRTPEGWEAYKRDMASKGVFITYDWTERGAGYIQVTGESTQLEFLKEMEDFGKLKERSGSEDTASYIADNYPIEASVWYWTNYEKTGEGNLNAYVEKNGASLEIFLITQYFVNSYQNGIDEYLRKIKEGGEYTIEDNKKLKIDGKEFNLPLGWGDRRKIWDNIYEQMKD